MRIAVLGAGAMGSVYAAHFAEAGHEVWAIDTWAQHVDEINANGLTLTGFTGDRTVQLQGRTSLEGVGTCDMYVVATKMTGVSSAAEAISPGLQPRATVVTIQNGLGAAELITEHLPAENVIVGVAQGFGAKMVGPGHAHQSGMQLLRLGALSGGLTTRLQAAERVWANAGFPTATYDDIEKLIWEKFIVNVALGGPSIVARLAVGELTASTKWRPIAMGCAREAFDIALALGVNISFDDPVAYVDAFVAKVPLAKPSMLQDHEAERPSELDAINGQVPIYGQRAGIPTPFNDEVCAQVRQLEAER